MMGLPWGEALDWSPGKRRP